MLASKWRKGSGVRGFIRRNCQNKIKLGILTKGQLERMYGAKRDTGKLRSEKQIKARFPRVLKPQ